MILQNTYKELYTLILIDLKVYIIDTCNIIFKFLTSQNKCIQVRILLNTSDIRRLDIMTVIVEMPGDDGMGMNETPNITSAIDIT